MTRCEPDPLEAELQAMSPAMPSADLHRRIHESLTELHRPALRNFPLGRAALLAVAACIALAMWFGYAHRVQRKPGNLAVNRPEALRLIAIDAQPPMSLANYQRALAESPARLDELLDAQSWRPMGPYEPRPVTMLAGGGRGWTP